MKNQKILEKLFIKYKENSLKEPNVSSLIQLAEFYSFTSTNLSFNKERYYWHDFIKKELIKYKCMSDIVTYLENREHRVNRILNYGNSLNEDEILLILTFLIEIEQILTLLEDFEYLTNYKFKNNIGKEFMVVMNEKTNKRNYELSKKMILKNSIMPIKSKWL